jgi:hypothetical protein
MEFGNQNRFFIQIDFDETSLDEWMWGRFCYWIDGNMVGDISTAEILQDVYRQLEGIKENHGGYLCSGRFCPELFALSNDKIYELVEGAIYRGYPYDEEIFQYLPSEDYIYGNLLVWPEIPSGWSVFLIDGETQSKLLYKGIVDQKVRSIILERGEFESVLAQACDYLAVVQNKIPKKMRVLITPKYRCYPVEIRNSVGMGGGNDAPLLLALPPVSSDIQNQLLEWAQEYDEVFDVHDMSLEVWEKTEDFGRFIEKGKSMAEKMKIELGGKVDVIFHVPRYTSGKHV